MKKESKEITIKDILLIKKMNKAIKDMEENLSMIDVAIPAEVKKWGGSAHIPFQKKYIGKKVKVIIYRGDQKKS